MPRKCGAWGRTARALAEFFVDAFTTVLGPAELVEEVVVKIPPKNSGGAYIAFKRCASVYASASAAVQLTMADRETCQEARIALGCVGLTAIRATQAETELRGKTISPKSIQAAADATMTAAEPQSDMRGSADYKRALVGALVKRAIVAAVQRSRGESVEVGHEYIASN